MIRGGKPCQALGAGAFDEQDFNEDAAGNIPFSTPGKSILKTPGKASHSLPLQLNVSRVVPETTGGGTGGAPVESRRAAASLRAVGGRSHLAFIPRRRTS
jgi:hypothetical protein